MEQKGVSPVVGTILLIAITVALAAVVATLVSGLGGRGTPPSAMLVVTATVPGDDQLITIGVSHEGGDDLATQDLEIKVEDETEAFPIIDPTLTVGEDLDITMTTTTASDGDVVTVFIIHVPSKQKIFSSSSVVVRE